MKRDLALTLTTILLILGLCFALAHAKTPLLPAISHSGDSVMGSVTAPEGEATPAGAAATTSTAATPGDRVVIRVNGEPITEKEYNTAFQQVMQQQPEMMNAPDAREKLVDQLVKMKALEQEARKLGADKDPDIASAIRLNRTSLLVGYALRKLIKPPTEADVRAAYEKDKTKFETVELSHILLAYAGSAAAEGRAAAPPLADAMKKANDIEARLRSGADFGVVAREVSDDPGTARQGGALGPVGHGVMPPEIESVVFRLKPGEISEPVKSQFGIHIFKAGQRRVQPFDQVKPGLEQKMRQELLDATLEKIKAGAKVEVDPEFAKKRG